MLVPTLGLLLTLSACQVGGTATVDLHVTNGGTQATTLALGPAAAGGAAAVASQAVSAHYVQSFTPSSLEVPVVQIQLTDSSTGAVSSLYTCDPASDPNACRVDLAQNLTGLQDLINSTAQAAAGTYDSINVITCTNGQGGSATSNPIDYTATITGEASLNGTRYYTDPTSPGLVSSGTAAAQPVDVGFSGCARSYPLPAPVTLTDGQTFTLSLYVDLAGIAWIDNNADTVVQTWLPSGCARDPNAGTPTSPVMPAGPFLCLNYADLAAAPGSSAPSLVRFLVVDGTAAPTPPQTGALFGLYFDSAGNPLSGYTRFFYAQTPAALGFMPATPFKTLAANPDGTTLTVETYGSSATGPGYFSASDFPLAGGAGVYASSDYDPTICANGGPCDYYALPLP